MDISDRPCTTLIYLQFGEICAGSHHVLPVDPGPSTAIDVIKIYPTLERREILLPEHIVFTTVIYYLYSVYVIAGLWLMDRWMALTSPGANYLFLLLLRIDNNY